MKHNLKVLPLEPYMRLHARGEKYIKNEPCNATFNREGFYCIYIDNARKHIAWFEVEGKAYVVNAEDFKFALNSLNTPYLRDCEFKALRVLELSGLISDTQKDILCAHRMRISCRRMLMDARRRRINILRRLHECKRS